MSNYTDNVKMVENVIANGKSYEGNPSDIIGEVEVVYQSRLNGKTIFTKNLYKNDLLVTGAVFVTEKINNMRCGYRPNPIDVTLGVHTIEEVDRTSATLPNELVCGLMIGNGGAGDTYNAVYKVNRAAHMCPGMIPFRVVKIKEDHTDLDEADRGKYFLRIVNGDYAYYYGKKFDIDREINVQYEDGTSVPLDANTSVTNKFIKVFTKYSVQIDARDVREYFKVTQGSTLKSLVNSIGLMTGYPGLDADGNEEFFNVRGMTTFNMENHELKDSESTITIIYRLFVQ